MQEDGLVKDPAATEMPNRDDQPPATVSIVQLNFASIGSATAMPAFRTGTKPSAIEPRDVVERSRIGG
jgi:hypothetical protein